MCFSHDFIIKEQDTGSGFFPKFSDWYNQHNLLTIIEVMGHRKNHKTDYHSEWYEINEEKVLCYHLEITHKLQVSKSQFQEILNFCNSKIFGNQDWKGKAKSELYDKYLDKILALKCYASDLYPAKPEIYISSDEILFFRFTSNTRKIGTEVIIRDSLFPSHEQHEQLPRQIQSPGIQNVEILESINLANTQLSNIWKQHEKKSDRTYLVIRVWLGLITLGILLIWFNQN